MCPSQGGGYCAPAPLCDEFNDGIDGSCKRSAGCAAHADCKSSEYCMDCARCAAYQNSLADDKKPFWSCDPCPSDNGGVCEIGRFCAIANDPIAGSQCPAYQGCDRENPC